MIQKVLVHAFARQPIIKPKPACVGGYSANATFSSANERDMWKKESNFVKTKVE
jgi:hypothetical protein